MRSAILGLALLLVPAAAFAQPFPCASSSWTPVRFDPYKPSHLAVVRAYGASVMASAPLEALLELDPYVPTHAALLREMGGALPFWAYASYPTLGFPPCEKIPRSSAAETSDETMAWSFTSTAEVLATLQQRRPAVEPGPAVGTTAPRGVSIQYAGRVWVSDGPAVSFNAGEFARVGERAGLPVFRRGDDAGAIYIATGPGMVAPFRTKN
jgi:hypothetical protein